jgi:hypothetical protein
MYAQVMVRVRGWPGDRLAARTIGDDIGHCGASVIGA